MLLAGFAEAVSEDPAQWSSGDVYQILNNSPWTKSVKIKLSSASLAEPGSQNAGRGPNDNWGNSSPARTVGGVQRRGMGGGRSSGTYGSGTNESTGTGQKSQPTLVTIQWQSALPVQIAAAKKSGAKIDLAAVKPLEDYVLAVVGLPDVAVGGRAASADSENTNDSDDQQRIAQHVKSSASLLRAGHDPLVPVKVELDQGVDGRMLIYFSKKEAITAEDKIVEFRLAMGKAELRKKFPLKAMEYRGRLEL